jgi:hypothetical protein
VPPPDAVTAFEALAAVSVRPARIMRPPPPVEEDGLPTHPGWAIDALLKAGAELAGAAGAAPAVVVLADLGLEEYRLGLALAGTSPRRAAPLRTSSSAHACMLPQGRALVPGPDGLQMGWRAASATVHPLQSTVYHLQSSPR